MVILPSVGAPQIYAECAESESLPRTPIPLAASNRSVRGLEDKLGSQSVSIQETGQ